MRILRVAQKLYPDVKGGAPYHVHAMSRDQVEMGHDVTVVTMRYDEELPLREERDGYTIRRFDPKLSPLGNDISPGLVRYLKNASEFDVVHAHSHLYFATNVAAAKRRFGETPLAITNHGLFSQNAPEWVFELYLRTVGRWTFNRADIVFCYTEADKSRVQEYGVTSRIEVVSNGIDTERFTPDGPGSELIESEGPVVLFVGRFVDGKRPWLAVKALARIRAEYPDAALYLCGEGPLEEELKVLAGELGVEAAVTFLGQIPYDEMPGVYRGADVVVLPSRAEGVPRTVMEALSTGVPVVCSDLEHVRSAFGDEVRYAECGTIGEFVEGIERELSVSETGYLDERYRWDITVEETTAQLESITIEGTVLG